LGSFAERLIAQSSIPVLTINPQTLARESIRKILVPTDFSRGTQQLIESAFQWAKHLSAEVVILNRFINPLSGLAYCGAAEVPVDGEFLNALIDDAEKERRAKGSEWLSFAKSMGVTCEVLYESDTEYLSTLILNAAQKEHIDLIVMGASRKVVGHGIGRTSRKILTESICPVILCPLFSSHL
jgi:nucleotide-binding universal stress UspA family protein